MYFLLWASPLHLLNESQGSLFTAVMKEQLPASSPCCYFRQMLLKCLASSAWNGPESKVEDYSETAGSRQRTFPGQDKKSNRSSVCFPGTRNLSLPCTTGFWSPPESQCWTCFNRTVRLHVILRWDQPTPRVNAGCECIGYFLCQ